MRRLGAKEVFDYKSPTLTADILKAAGGSLKYVADPIANPSSFTPIKDVVAPGSKLGVLMPYKDGDSITTSDGSGLYLSIPDLRKKEFPGIEIIEVTTSSAFMDVSILLSLHPSNCNIFNERIHSLKTLGYLKTSYLYPCANFWRPTYLNRTAFVC